MPSLLDDQSFLDSCKPIRLIKTENHTSKKKNNPEAKIQDNIIAFLLGQGFFPIRINSSNLPGADSHRRVPSYVAHSAAGKGHKHTAGHPDIVAYKGTQAIFFEVKTPEAYRAKENGASERQVRFIEVLHQFGAHAHIVCSVEQVQKVLLESGL